jgi:drug/metabolite transporter (DMT)-like permease
MKKDWMLFALPGAIWGASFLFIAEGLEIMGPFGIAFVRLLVGFAALSAFPAARRSIDGGAWLAIAAVGLFWMAFPLTMFPLAELRVNTAVTGMLNGAVPFFATMVATLIARRAPSRQIVTGLLVGLAGSVLIALPTANEGKSSAVGIGMIIAAVASYGIAINIARPLQMKHGALPVIWRAQMVALVLTAPLECRICWARAGRCGRYYRCSRWVHSARASRSYSLPRSQEGWEHRSPRRLLS